MRKTLTAIVLFVASSHLVDAHGVGSTPTWNREISRLIYAHCASCHRPGGTAFSLMTYQDTQPRANAARMRCWPGACLPGEQ
jgi:mono/diheme cytochrome c family protein